MIETQPATQAHANAVGVVDVRRKAMPLVTALNQFYASGIFCHRNTRQFRHV